MKIMLCAFFCSLSIIVSASEKVRISPGGVVYSNGQVKTIGIGSPVLRGVKGKPIPITPRAAPVTKVIASAAEISSEFKLADVYVYPNPAMGGQIPTFHIEAGIADSVKITVYTVSGEIAYTYTISGLPGAINDGNGLEYAYEYAWRGHIPSGVYYFVAEAQKAGKKLKKTGKFAVVR